MVDKMHNISSTWKINDELGDGMVAQSEHTVLITNSGSEVLTN